ncbi:MAG TPA: MFS transporter [Burkholderiaceae bacterium]|nr:MFS transporter [Burkholderiaceae bacterium]
MSVIAAPTSPALPSRGPLERFLRLFTDVRGGEGTQLLLLTLNAFLILAAYYVVKPVRQALILEQPGGAELQSYAYAAQAVLLLILVPLYGALATRLPRRRLINVVTLFFIAWLPAFYLLAEARAPIGLVFFLWIGVFSLMVIAQFWAYANDIYTPEAGKRLFAVIAFGASSGAVFGAWISRHLIRLIGVSPLLLAAAAILALSLVLFNFIDLRRAPARQRAVHGRKPDVPIGDGNAFALVLRGRYLLLMALLILLLNWVNSAGEYILAVIVKHAADADIAAGTLAAGEERRFIGAFFADYFQIVNIAGMVLQLFFVSRVVKYLGVPVALCIAPLIALGSYATAALIPSLAIMRWVKTAENSVDYSLMNTVRQMLFLPTSREEKYKAKQVIDSFVVRAGDVLAAATVYLGTTLFALSVSQFACINAALVLVWLVLALLTGREFQRRTAARQGATL